MITKVRTYCCCTPLVILSGLLAATMTTASCKSKEGQSAPASNHPEDRTIQIAQSDPETPRTLNPTGNPEKDWIIVEQAVDAWLYFHLSDFRSYEPLIRSSDYDPDRDIYTHHLRFRMINEQGGPVILDRDYEVDLNRPGVNGNPFHVKEK